MKPEEAFALHIRSRFKDMANNCSGILRCWADDIAMGREKSPKEFHDFLRRQADDLQDKLKMVLEEVEMFVGGRSKFIDLLKEDWDSGWKISSPSEGIWANEKRT